jgi:hypothetical protein
MSIVYFTRHTKYLITSPQPIKVNKHANGTDGYELLNLLLQSVPRIPSGVTMNGAFSEGRDGDLNM